MFQEFPKGLYWIQPGENLGGKKKAAHLLQGAPPVKG
jgi:hypothetical protein